MLEIVYYAAASLDGFIATPDGGVDWLPPIEAEGEDYGYYDFYGSIDAIVMGSATYENILRQAAWPYAGKPCWVFTRQRRYAKSSNADVTFTAAPPEHIAEEIAGLGSKRAWIVGGGKLAASFRERGLITTYGIGIVPTIVGTGIRLLEARGPLDRLTLSGCQAYPDGVVMLWYRKAEG
ncbi:MAG TPA: dihydrofolate reductase family protein [Dongiaceae bacterium]|jgi:dihydrofolate reductase